MLRFKLFQTPSEKINNILLKILQHRDIIEFICSSWLHVKKLHIHFHIKILPQNRKFNCQTKFFRSSMLNYRNIF